MQVVFKRVSDPGLAAKSFHALTKLRLLTDFPHGGIVVNGTLMHANLQNGLHAIPFVDDGRWLIIDVPGDEDRVLALFEQYEGTPYDVFSLLAFVQPFDARDANRLYCFEWQWLALTGEMPHFRVTPEMLLVVVISLLLKSTESGYNNQTTFVNKDIS